MSDSDGRRQHAPGRLASYIAAAFVVAALFLGVPWIWSAGERRDALQEIAACQPTKSQTCPGKSYIEEARSANADEDAVDIAVVQAILASVGFVALIYTVLYARGALTEAQASATSARDALKHSEEVSERQLRPYVYFTRVSDTAKPLTYEQKTTILLKNFGQTPARGVVLRRGAKLANRPIGDDLVALGEAMDAFDLPPGGSQGIDFTMSDLTREEFDSFTNPELSIVLLIRLWCTYEYAPGLTDSDDMTLVLGEDAALHGSWPRLGTDERKRR